MHKLNFTIGTYFLIFSIAGFSQQTTFIKHIEIGEASVNRGVTVEELKTEGYILTGYTSDAGGNEDVFLLKTDSKGNTIWSRTYGGSGKDNGWAVRQTNDGGFIVVGFTDSFGAGNLDVYVIKTDSEGHAIWTKTYGGSGEEYGWDIRLTIDNGFIIAAQTDSFGEGEIDAYLIKIDSNGNEIWSNTFGGDKVDRVFSVQEAVDGSFSAAGISYSYDSVGPNDRDGYFLKTDAKGNQLWYKTYGEDDYDVYHSISLTKDGGYFITGYGESHAIYGSRDAYLVKTNSSGEIEWTQVIGTEGEERGIKGIETKDGNYVAVGFCRENFDLYLIKANNKGKVLWTKSFGEKNELEFGYTVRETRDGGLIITGHNEDPQKGESSILLIKTDAEGMIDKQ